MSGVPAMRQPLAVGLIGYGHAGRTFHVPLIRAVAGLHLAAIASSRPQQVEQEQPGVRVLRDGSALLRDDRIQIVVIAVPNEAHASWVRAALQAGKHVVVDKPFVLTLEEARALTVLAEQRRRVLSVFQNRRWDSDYLGIREVLDAGLIGRVVHFESHLDRYRPEVRQRWREGEGPGAGIWYDLGPHLIDQALLLFGLPTAVSADLAILRAGGRSSDWAHALLLYPERRVVLHASMLVAGGSNRFQLHGELGSVIKRGADQQETQLLAGTTPGDSRWGVDTDPLQIWRIGEPMQERQAPPGDQRRYYEALERAVRAEGPPPTPACQILGVMAVLEAGIESARRGATVPLGLTPAERAAWG